MPQEDILASCRPFIDFYLTRIANNEPGLLQLSLVERYVDDSSLSLLVSAMENNTEVKTLNLSGNLLTDKSMKVLWEALKDKAQIEVLILDGNNGITDEGCLLAIRLLNQNSSIRQCSINCQNISKCVAQELSDAVLRNSFPAEYKKAILSLEPDRNPPLSIDISGANKTNLAGLSMLRKGLLKNNSVTQLNVSGCCKGEKAVEELADIIKHHEKLSEIAVASSGITDKGAKLLCDALKENTTITDLDMTDNEIGDSGAKHLIDLVMQNEMLSHILLNKNNVTPSRRSQVVHSLLLNSQPLKLKQAYEPLYLNSSKITSVIIDGNTPSASGKLLNNISCRVLSNCLDGNTTVRTLKLPNNRIGDDGAILLSLLLIRNQVIETVDLRGNTITKKGAAHFGKALSSNTTVRICDLSDQVPEKIAESDLKEVKRQLELNAEPLALKRLIPLLHANDPSVTVVDLTTFDSSRTPSERTCSLLTDALKTNTHVTEITVPDNPQMGKIGLKQLLDVVAVGQPPVVTLRLCGMGLTDADGPLITNLIKNSKKLQVLDLSQNSFSAVSDWTAQLLEVNHTLQDIILTGSVANADPEEINRLKMVLSINTQPLELKKIILRVYGNDPTLKEISLLEYEGSKHGGSYRYRRRYDCKSALLLGDALAENKHVKKLDLSYNSIREEGAKALGNMLLYNRSLTTLNISHNYVNDAGLLAISDALLTNPCLGCIVTDGNLSVKPSTRKQLNLSTCHNSHTAAEAYCITTTLAKGMSCETEIAAAITSDALAQYKVPVSLRSTMGKFNEQVYM